MQTIYATRNAEKVCGVALGFFCMFVCSRRFHWSGGVTRQCRALTGAGLSRCLAPRQQSDVDVGQFTAAMSYAPSSSVIL